MNQADFAEQTPLFSASGPDVAEMLLKKKGHLGHKDSFGRTLGALDVQLMCACLCPHACARQ